MLIPKTVGALRKDFRLPTEDEHLNRLLYLTFFVPVRLWNRHFSFFGGEYFAQSVSFGNEEAAGC
jgi:hypothetical protein